MSRGGFVPPSERLLPEGFADLDPFVAHWAVAGQNERRFQRSEASFEEIKCFYDAMLPRADEALDHLSAFSLRDMPGPERRLMQLVLSLAQASMAVEVHGEARVPKSPWPNSITVVSDEVL